MKRVLSIAVVTVLVGLGGCVAGGAAKPLTPTEVQVITQVVAHRMVLPKLTPAGVQRVLVGLASAKAALETASPIEVMKHLEHYLGPENADIAALIGVLVQERVDLTQLPDLEGKAYVYAVLSGVEGGLK